MTTLVEDKSNISESEVDEIKSIFKTIVESGERYNVDEIEFWFENDNVPKFEGKVILPV